MSSAVKTALSGYIDAYKASPLLGPAAVLFISANVANVANLAFNMIFARLMGPALFADLTLLLTLKLGLLSFLGAVQFAVSELSAKESSKAVRKAKVSALSWKSLKISIPIMFAVMASANFISASLNFSSPLALALLALALPFFLPMVIYRGLTQGTIDLPKIVLSVQSEWIIRLCGSVILWQLGFGLAGIAVAVALSILAGFLFSADKQDFILWRTAKQTVETSEVKLLGLMALPYLILQLAQVLVLDSDILIAKTFFSAQAAGLVAGLLLIQRIFFFAFLSCSMILQPYIARQNSDLSPDDTAAQNRPKELLTLLAGISVITALALVVIVPNSDLIVKIMLGDAYAPLASIVWISALTGAVFIVSHLCAIYQIAKGQTFAARLVLAFGIIQLISLSAVNHFLPEMGLHSFFSIKLAIQTVCAMCLLGIIMSPQKRLRHKV